MKVSYRREMKHNYMIIDPEELVWRSYECQMMENNVIEGLLRLHVRQSDAKIQFHYEITSRQPLGRLLENRTVSGEEIRRLVIGISNALDQTERFLLSESSILLKPDYIYVEPEAFRIWLCLVPGLKLDFPEAYGALLEYILGKVNHQDKDSVVLAYGLYQETRKENYGMEDILRLLRQNSPSEPSEAGADAEGEEEERDTYMPDRKEGASGGGIPVRQVAACPAPGKKSLWMRIKEFVTRRQKIKREEEPAQMAWQEMFREEEPELQAEAPLSSFPASDFVPTGQGTVLLADLASGEVTRRLRALDYGESDIVLSYYPFIIGKQENMADYVLNHETVSRLHVRIDQIGEQFQIMDLNSTNGTVVRGKLLENNETAVLQIGDELQIAKYRYRFE